MKNIKFICLLFASFTLLSSSCKKESIKVYSKIYGQWQQANGLYGETVNCFAQYGKNIFVGTEDSGVFKSSNNGSSWTNIGLTNISVHALAVKGDTIFAGSWNSGVFLSTNNGASWHAINNGLPYLYNDWSKVININALVIKGDNIFAGTYIDGIFLSTNNGGKWNQVVDNLSVTSFAVSGNNIFALLENNRVISLSDDGNWRSMGIVLPANVSINALAIYNTNIIVGIDQGVYCSSNNGNNWVPMNNGLPDNISINAIAISGDTIFAGTNGYGVWRNF